jgi:PAS domain S-box-containing protein
MPAPVAVGTSGATGEASEAGLRTDFRLAFALAPVGMVISRRRVMVDCNEAVCEIFGYSRELMLGQSFMLLYPSHDEFERQGERMLAALHARGRWSDQRVMRRATGESFWCRVSGRAQDRADPHAAGIWCFEDLGARQPVKAELTAREREVAARLLDGLTSKEIGRALDISHRTVEIHRARLMRKYGAATSAELVQKLLMGA